METKITFQKIKHFKQAFFSAVNVLIVSLYSILTTAISAQLAVVLVFVFVAPIAYCQSSNCQGVLKVAKDRNTKSVSTNGTYYAMEISNTGSATAIYNLNAVNVNSSCTNNDGTSTSTNVNLTIQIVDTNLQTISTISIPAGETVRFLVSVKPPIGTPYSKWNCTQIIAMSTSCAGYSINTTLHSLVSDPTQE